MHRGANFTSTYLGVNARLALCLNSVLNVKALVGAFNQEKALVGAFSVIVQHGGDTIPLKQVSIPWHHHIWILDRQIYYLHFSERFQCQLPHLVPGPAGRRLRAAALGHRQL